MALPRLRSLDITKVEEKGEILLILRDTEGYTDNLMILSPIEALIASRLDGTQSARQIAESVSRQTGLSDLTIALVEKLIKKLDDNYMLASDHLDNRKREILDNFRQASRRPAALAGRSYPSERDELTRSLNGYFEAEGAPGQRPTPDGSAPLTGLVAPHIDFPRGHIGYAWAYREIFRSGLADLYAILGVAHATPPTPFVLTAKDYDTPFGPAEVDITLARALEKEAPYDLRADELTHRSEHSIEFQAVYLKYIQSILGGDFKILPILCSSYDLQGSNPGKRTMDVLESLEKLLKKYDGRVCLLAGVDFAHIGPCFGDPCDVDEVFLKRTQEEDRLSIEKLILQDSKGFLDSVMADGNKRKVCGVSALYAFSHLHKNLHPKTQAELLHYGHAADPTGGEVTFASLSYR